MLSGLYGYMFGGEESNDSICQENVAPYSEEQCCRSGKMTEDDWCLVEEPASGRSSPVLIPHPDVRDIDTLSFASKKASPPPSADAIRRSEEYRRAKAVTAHRLQLERVLFSDTPLSLCTSVSFNKPAGQSTTSTAASATVLKRASAVAHGDNKAKQRSKKAGRMSSGRNNDRKVNNLA